MDRPPTWWAVKAHWFSEVGFALYLRANRQSVSSRFPALRESIRSRLGRANREVKHLATSPEASEKTTDTCARNNSLL